MANGKTWFYGCKIYTEGWAAVSTDAAQGYVYVEAIFDAYAVAQQVSA